MQAITLGGTIIDALVYLMRFSPERRLQVQQQLPGLQRQLDSLQLQLRNLLPHLPDLNPNKQQQLGTLQDHVGYLWDHMHTLQQTLSDPMGGQWVEVSC
jgi:hypothetical protein